MLIESEELKAWMEESKEISREKHDAVHSSLWLAFEKTLWKITELEQKQNNKLPCGHDAGCLECIEENRREATKRHGW